MPIPPELENALGFNLNRVARLFRNELMRALADYRMTPEQWQVMQSLWSTNEPLNQNEIANLTMKDRHTVSRIVDRLERDGWITRKSHPTDGRAFIVEPTANALSLRHEVPGKVFAHFSPVLSALDSSETEQLLRLLKKLRNHFGDEA